MDVLELVAHPARMRIVHALSGGDTLTTGQLRAQLPDVSKAMVYRHVEALATAGVLAVVDERRVRGAVERHYRLNRGMAVIDDEAVAQATIEDHRRVFTTAMAVLVAEFNAYLDRDDASPAADLVGYRQHSLWVSPGELHQLMDDLHAAIVPYMMNEPTASRSRYLLSPIFFPAGGAGPHT